VMKDSISTCLHQMVSQMFRSIREQHEKDMYLEKLQLKRTVVNEERDRLGRIEMLKEEDGEVQQYENIVRNKASN
jgi:hypothetical protein